MVGALEVTESLDELCFSRIGCKGIEKASSAPCGVCSPPPVIFPVPRREGLPQEARCGLGPDPVLVDLVMYGGKLWGRRVQWLPSSICG
jgi:hypothetical protein